MQLKRDYFENLEVPEFVLCKANRERIGVIPCTDKTADFNFGDMNEISFKTYYMIDGEHNPIYDEIDVMKYVLVPKVGFFYIQSCSTQSEGTEHEYKDVKCQSIEGLLGQKYLENFLVNTGETGSKELEFDSTGNTHIYLYLSPSQKVGGKMDLFDYILEKCPDWYVAYCDPVLQMEERSHRSFNVDRQDVYSFIMNDVQESFECYVIFDTINLDSKGRCGIYIYAQENYEDDTDIYVSYDNLLQSTNISTDTDDIKTCVVLKGKDELEIREVNFGYDRLYNFDYYNNTQFWSQELYDEYNAWYEKTYVAGNIARSPDVYTEDISNDDLAKMSYLDLYEYRLQKYLEAREKLDNINNLTSSFVNDENRGIGSGEFPVFDNDGNEIGSIKFETDTGVRVTQNLPASPGSGENNYIYIIKKINSTLDINTLRAQETVYRNAQKVERQIIDPIPMVANKTIYTLQNKFSKTVDRTRLNLINELKALEEGGSVNLLNRPAIDTQLLEKAGWGEQEPGIATVYISTYSDESGRIVMNFTPIQVNSNGKLKQVWSPRSLQRYAESIIAKYKKDGKYDDSSQLKVGGVFSSIGEATDAARRIRNLHRQYFESGAYWTFFDKNVTYNDRTKVRNVTNLQRAIEDEREEVNRFINQFENNYNRNKSYYHHETETLDYDTYNEAKTRKKVLDSISKNSLIWWKPEEKIYFIPKPIGQALIATNSAFQSLLTEDTTKNRYIINNISRYDNLVHKNYNTVINQIQVTLATSTVSYPGYQIYRWFDNTNTKTFYNALVSADATFKSTGTISVADARVLRNEEFGNPLYNTCYKIIEGTNTVEITDVDKFQEYLAEDLEEQTALITIFPNSAWFNTNDWQGYGYSELSDTWALSIDQILATMSKSNWGSAPNKSIETSVNDCKYQATSAEDDPYNYYGNYLPAYLTQLAIEERIAALDKQINGYDTYPYTINSKGSIYFEKLPSSHAVGDTYTISNRFTLDGVVYPAGTNVTWNGSKWVITSSLATHVDGIQDEIDQQAEYKAQVVQEIALDNNLSEASRIELSLFIREEELSSDNFLVTDTMTEEERSEMLKSFVEYGKKELAKVSVPQLSFTANILNLFSIPEFDGVSEDFEPGKSIYVCIRDDYHVRAMLLNVHINYYDPTDFSMTFSDVLKREKGLYTDLQDAINTATSAATSVALGSSTWTSGAATATRIYSSLEAGLLSQGAYLSDNPAKSTFEISDIGIFVDTASGDYGRYDVLGEEKFVYDSIYIGGGRILFTDDGWKHVRMSLGRSKVDKINSNGKTSSSEEFGVFADFCISAYVGGSQICGGELYSSAFCNNGTNPITYFDLDNGTFVMRNKDTGDAVLEFDGSELIISGYDEDISALRRDLNTEVTNRTNGDSFLDGKITTVDGKFASYTTTKALAQWLSGNQSITTLTKIRGGLIQTGFISAGSGVSWINLDDGSFNFGGGLSSAGNYIAWDKTSGKLTVNGEINASSGKIAGMTISSSSISASSGSTSVYLGTDGIRFGIGSWNPPGFSNGFFVKSDGTFSSGPATISRWTISGHVIYDMPNSLTPTFNGIRLDADNKYIQIDSLVIKSDGNGNIANNISGNAATASSASYSSDCGKISGSAGYCYVGEYGFNPGTTETINCGGGAHKWKTVYAKEGTINTSDRREKKDITKITEPYENLFFDLEPVKYMFYGGDRIHIGYISQDVEQSLYKNNLTALDFAGFCHDVIKTEDEDEVEVYDQYALRYSEFIALNTHMIQKLYKRVEELEQEIERIKNGN